MAEMMACRSCQKPVGTDANFCPACGARLGRDTPASSADPLRESLAEALGANYEIVRLLGRGGMGAVYLARERTLERLVAVKVLRPERADDAAQRERFRREARTAAGLMHPNIVPLHSFGEAGGMVFFVMGYVRGESLSERLRREPRIPIAETRAILAEIASALDHAHRNGVVHRDIKPANVIIDDGTGRAMLTDFGVAKTLDSGATLTETGSLVGTPRYMSPEQASGKKEIDGRSDIYSLGVMGYAMLAGRLPFEGPTPREIILQHLTSDPAPLERVAAEVPHDLADSIRRCLAKEPSARPDAASLRDRLLGGASREEELPEGLQRIEGMAFMVLVFAIVSGIAAAYHFAVRAKIGIMGTAFLRMLEIGVTVPLSVGLLAGIMMARWKGFPWQQIINVSFRPHEGWGLWYPARFRRPGDVWHRLPDPLRQHRILSTAAVMYFLICFPAVLAMTAVWFPAKPPAWGHYFIYAVFATIMTSVAALVISWRRCLPLIRNRGLSAKDMDRVLGTSTAKRSFWTKPEIAALLLPQELSPRSAVVSPQQNLDQVVRLARMLDPSFRVDGREATDAARKLLSLLNQLDSELENLSREADSQEAERITKKIESLEPVVAIDPERLQMRELLSRQLALLRQFQERLKAARLRRTGSADLLFRLRTAMDELIHVQRDPSRSNRAIMHLRELCHAVVQQQNPADRASQIATESDLPTTRS